MRHYELLPHVADVRLKIVGDSLKELFTAGVEGMSHLIKQVGCEAAQPGCSEMIEISAIDTTVLLIDFLAEVLTYSHMNRTVYRTVKFHELS
jgi:SHS2 domain-containing protein